MTTHTTVGINNDLATGQAGVGVWSALDEVTSRVDVNGVIVICKLRWDDRTNDLLN